MQIYIVRPGDSLYSVARRFGTNESRLAEINQLSDPSRLAIGMSLVIPGGEEAARGSIEVNAYDYPNVSSEVLEETNPYLTYLCPFCYSARADGSLSGIDDGRLISIARSGQTAPLMVVTNLSESSGFSSDIAHSLLTDEAAQSALLENITAVLREKNYYGLNINFEYIYPFDRDSYSQFVARAAERMHALGYPVSTALAPKESAEQGGLLYTAHDYEAHGRYADRVVLMTYEWGYTYGSPQAISPVNRIRRVLDYAVTVMPTGKILMGFSNYAYDWLLPWRQGQAARILSNAAAVELAISRGAEIKYDYTAQAPWFNYADAAGRTHVVWFEDARSVVARLQLVGEYSLAGISIWTADKVYRPGLYALQSMYSVEKLL